MTEAHKIRLTQETKPKMKQPIEESPITEINKDNTNIIVNVDSLLSNIIPVENDKEIIRIDNVYGSDNPTKKPTEYDTYGYSVYKFEEETVPTSDHSALINSNLSNKYDKTENMKTKDSIDTVPDTYGSSTDEDEERSHFIKRTVTSYQKINALTYGYSNEDSSTFPYMSRLVPLSLSNKYGKNKISEIKNLTDSKNIIELNNTNVNATKNKIKDTYGSSDNLY